MAKILSVINHFLVKSDDRFQDSRLSPEVNLDTLAALYGADMVPIIKDTFFC